MFCRTRKETNNGGGINAQNQPNLGKKQVMRKGVS
jgi:hypothetical protein